MDDDKCYCSHSYRGERYDGRGTRYEGRCTRGEVRWYEVRGERGYTPNAERMAVRVVRARLIQTLHLFFVSGVMLILIWEFSRFRKAEGLNSVLNSIAKNIRMLIGG